MNSLILLYIAGKSGVRNSMADPAGYWKNNVEVSKRLFARYPDTPYFMQVVQYMNLI